jgi:hypothetical protein
VNSDIKDPFGWPVAKLLLLMNLNDKMVVGDDHERFS